MYSRSKRDQKSGGESGPLPVGTPLLNDPQMADRFAAAVGVQCSDDSGTAGWDL